VAISEGDRAIIVAIELLRDRITQLPLAIAQNAASAAAEATRPTGPANAPATGGSGSGGPINRAANAAGMLATRFAAILGPLAAFGRLLAAPTSGMSVFSRALSLLAASIAPILLPAIFLLTVGLAASSEVIFSKLMPALEGFYRLILSSGIPTVLQFVETVGRATSALVALADSKVGKAVMSGDSGGGMFGGFNRTLDRLGYLTGLSSDDPDKGRSTLGSLEAGADDFMRMMPGGSRLVGLKNWAASQLGGNGLVGGGDATGGGTAAGLSSGAVGRARADTLRELMLSMGPKASSGSVSSVWSRAQMASLNQSPFERRMLDMMSTVVGAISRADGTPGTGRFTERMPGGGIRGGLPGAAGAV
jgi:hypothetical protein